MAHGNIKHGLASSKDKITPEYTLWRNIKDRCLNKKNKSYKYYGGRGISICELWVNDFSAFLNDVGPRRGKHLSLDRIDNNGNYEPGNVRWATHKTQMNNTRLSPTIRKKCAFCKKIIKKAKPDRVTCSNQCRKDNNIILRSKTGMSQKCAVCDNVIILCKGRTRVCCSHLCSKINNAVRRAAKCSITTSSDQK